MTASIGRPVLGSRAPGVEHAPIAAWLAERRDSIADDAITAIWEAVASYRDTGLDEDVRSQVVHVVTGFVASIRERREPAPEDFPWAGLHAGERVAAGVPLADMLRAFRVGEQVLWASVRDYAREHPEHSDVALTLVSPLMRAVEVASAEAAAGYLEAQERQRADDERRERDLLEELLEGRAPTAPGAEQLLHARGLGAERPYVALVARDAEGGTALPAVRAALLRGGTGLVVVRHGELVGLLPQAMTGALPATSRPGVAMGLSTVHVGTATVSDAYREARVACDTSRGSTIAAFADLSPLDYLVGRPDRLARRLVRPEALAFFAADRAADGIFAESLDAYVRNNLNAREAAQALHLHVNTLYYRLERITERTGCDLHSLDEVVGLLLAIRALDGED